MTIYQIWIRWSKNPSTIRPMKITEPVYNRTHGYNSKSAPKSIGFGSPVGDYTLLYNNL
jgi:hypothetical protein